MKYGGAFNWQRAALGQDSLGNIVQNSRTINAQLQANFTNLYNKLAKPNWTPAPATIGMIWTILYPIIAISFGFVFIQAMRRKIPWSAALPFAINLMANVAFTPIQFGLRNMPLASVDILIVWGSILWMMWAVWPRYRWVTLGREEVKTRRFNKKRNRYEDKKEHPFREDIHFEIVLRPIIPPALLISTSMRPKAATASRTMRSTFAVFVTSHSKLRACAVGPELRSGALPADLQGSSRIRRGERVVWEKPFATGEANMCHTLANLEYHHFKYAQHRRPGDVHLHFFGTATLSFADGMKTSLNWQR